MSILNRAVHVIVVGWFVPLFAGTFFAAHAAAFDARPIPDEYEASTGTSLALNNAGSAAADPHSAIRLNPALLSADKTYSVSAGYHWPTAGRDFYQAAIVDAKTSSIAAGVSYTGFTEDFKSIGTEATPDSPLIRRGVIGLSMPLGKISAGVGGTYIEANCVATFGNCPDSTNESPARIKGFGLNLGIAGALGQGLRLGASVENATNKKIADYAPKTMRAGVAYAFAPTVTGYLDYRQRDRILAFEGPTFDWNQSAEAARALENKQEEMFLGSLTAQIYDLFRLMASYGQALSDNRRSLAGGLAVVNKSFNLSYTMSRPYMSLPATNSAISIGLDMAM